MGRLKRLSAAAKRFAGTARSLRCFSSRKPSDPGDSKHVVSEQISVATSSSGPSTADVKTPAVISYDLLVPRDGAFRSTSDPQFRPAPQPSPDAEYSLRRTSVHIKSTVAAEITESPLESGAEVLLNLPKAKRTAGLRRAATSALSIVSSSPGRCREILSKSLSSATPTQWGKNDSDHQEKKDADATCEESAEAEPVLDDVLTQGAVNGKSELGAAPHGVITSIETGPRSGIAAVVDCKSPVTMEIDVALRQDDAQNLNDTVTLADSLTSDEEDSVNSDPFSKLSDSPNDLPVIDVGSLGSSGKVNVDMVEETNAPGAVDDGEPVPESQAVTSNGALPKDKVDEEKTGHVSFLSEFRKRHQRRALPTVDEGRDFVGSEINCVRSQDEAESFQRNSSVLSTASSILVDDRSDHVLRRRKLRNHGTACADNCDCLGSGNYEDRSVELSNGSSIMSDDSEYEYSEASVPTCYICLQASEARGSIWQDLK